MNGAKEGSRGASPRLAATSNAGGTEQKRLPIAIAINKRCVIFNNDQNAELIGRSQFRIQTQPCSIRESRKRTFRFGSSRILRPYPCG